MAIDTRTPRRYRIRLAVAAVLAVTVLQCAPEPEVRAQHVLFVDTDLPLVGQSPETDAAAVDALRIDVYDATGTTLRSTRDLKVVLPGDWPVSLGLVGAARVRIRLFRTRRALPAPAGGLEPDPAVSVDRLVDLPEPGRTIQHTRVVLRGDCIGRPSVPASGNTCVDEARPYVFATSGRSAPGPSLVGTWPRSRPEPCVPGLARASTACVPGGFGVLGAPALSAASGDDESPSPLRPFYVRAFYMDKTEYTVGRFVARGGAAMSRGTGAECSPLAGDPKLPLTCVSRALALELCALDGGELPTEAQWEHAARSAGRDRPFPWGDAAPVCYVANAGGAGCHASLMPVGLFPSVAAGPGDETAQGVLDLGGNVAEWVRDPWAPARLCWDAGLAREPVCVAALVAVGTSKGGSYGADLERTAVAFRKQAPLAPDDPQLGFRCVYRGVAD